MTSGEILSWALIGVVILGVAFFAWKWSSGRQADSVATARGASSSSQTRPSSSPTGSPRCSAKRRSAAARGAPFDNRRGRQEAAAELLLQVAPEPRGAHVRLHGQVLDDGLPVGGAAVSLRGDACAADRTTDEDGEFRVVGLPAGGYALAVDTPTRRFGVDGLDLS